MDRKISAGIRTLLQYIDSFQRPTHTISNGHVQWLKACGFSAVYLRGEKPGASQHEHVLEVGVSSIPVRSQEHPAGPGMPALPPLPSLWVSPICAIDWFISQQVSLLVYLEPSFSRRLNPASCLWYSVPTSRSFQSDFTSVSLAYKTWGTYLPTAGDLQHFTHIVPGYCSANLATLRM